MRAGPLLVLLAAAVVLPAVSADHPAMVPGVLGSQRSAPIVIEGDLGFLAPPDVSGVRSGLGNGRDPFVIAGWSIVSLPFNPTVGNLGYSNLWQPCILLQNTHAHVVIRDNYIKGNNCHGIWLQNASNVTIERNQVLHNTGHGIVAEAFGPPLAGHTGRGLVVRDNVVRGNGFDGIRVFYQDDVRVERNALVANANFGLLARESPGVRVRGNVADYNEVSGFFIELSDGALVEGNTARWNIIGFDMEMNTAAIVRGNLARENRDLGIYTSDMSMNTVVEYNLVEANGLGQEAGWNDGIALTGVMDVARWNTVRGNRDGVSVGPQSQDIQVNGNLIEDNLRGVVLEACPCEVLQNAIRGNDAGIVAVVAGCGDVMDNNIAGNLQGALAPAGHLDAPRNWWGSAQGPRAEGNPGGDGDAVGPGVAWSPFRAAPSPDAP